MLESLKSVTIKYSKLNERVNKNIVTRKTDFQVTEATTRGLLYKKLS